MAMPTDIPIIDTMIGFPKPDFSTYDFIRAQTKDSQSSAKGCPRSCTAPIMTPFR